MYIDYFRKEESRTTIKQFLCILGDYQRQCCSLSIKKKADIVKVTHTINMMT